MDDLKFDIKQRMLARGPYCPLDLPEEVWKAVAANYADEDQWVPGPNYHVEYRDARTAVMADRARWERYIETLEVAVEIMSVEQRQEFHNRLRELYA